MGRKLSAMTSETSIGNVQLLKKLTKSQIPKQTLILKYCVSHPHLQVLIYASIYLSKEIAAI